jgi:hypothetical protein
LIVDATDVQGMTIREAGMCFVLALGHPVHEIENESRTRRLLVHLMHAIDSEDALARSYGHLMHTRPPQQRQRAAMTSISTE